MEGTADTGAVLASEPENTVEEVRPKLIDDDRLLKEILGVGIREVSFPIYERPLVEAFFRTPPEGAISTYYKEFAGTKGKKAERLAAVNLMQKVFLRIEGWEPKVVIEAGGWKKYLKEKREGRELSRKMATRYVNEVERGLPDAPDREEDDWDDDE
jgi:hypothetical protein